MIVAVKCFLQEILVDKPLKKFVTSEKICTFVTPTATETRFLSPTETRSLSPTETPRFHFYLLCGSSSVGRASASQAEGREFEPRLPLPLARCPRHRAFFMPHSAPYIANISCPIFCLTSPTTCGQGSCYRPSSADNSTEKAYTDKRLETWGLCRMWVAVCSLLCFTALSLVVA